MSEAFQKDVMKELRSLKSEVDYIKEFLEDTRLTLKEKKFVDNRIRKINSGDTSNFVSWKQAKKRLG